MRKKYKQTVVFSILIASCTSCLQPNHTGEAVIPQTLPPAILYPTEMPPTLQLQTDTTSYKPLSPTMVQNASGTMTFEVSASLTMSTFVFRVDAFVPAEFEFQYPDYNYPSIYEEVEVAFKPEVTIVQNGGGGGSETLENRFTFSSQQEYQVKSSIEAGQVVNLTATVHFGEFTGIKEPVTFELLLNVQK